MKNMKLIIQYDGTRYRGWQRLKNSDNTIQGKIESVLSKMVGEDIQIIASGRTDSGVHAYMQVANFSANTSMTPKEIKSYFYNYLPEDIVVTDVCEVDSRFHARYSVTSKTYVYKIWNSPYHDPFGRKYLEHIPENLDLSLMKEAKNYLIGKHDFTSFCTSKSKKKSNIRTIHSIDIKEDGPLIEIFINANGFLYNMVRIIVGTLVQVGLGEIHPSDIESILLKKERALAGPTISPKGLYLLEVIY